MATPQLGPPRPGSGNLEELSDLARRVRTHALRMTSSARSSHVGSCLSVADILAVIYGGVARVDPAEPAWRDRDRIVVSKGHAAAAVYATLAETGFCDPRELVSYGRAGSRLCGHVTRGAVPGIEVSTGSLGHGLPIATGMALACKRDGSAWRVFVVMSDGEWDEGSNWEAAMFASHHRLDNLVVVVDFNGLQSLTTVDATLRLEPFADKLRAFGWTPVEVDGHDLAALRQTLSSVPAEPARPTAVIARTTKGKGVSFMEDEVLWHYRFADEEELERALLELGERP